MTDINRNILTFHQQLVSDKNHRYLSWEHCFLYFQNRNSFSTKNEIDTASLHLAFYLASWGMYRGSSFLLWKDYKIHIPVVKELLNKKYSPLWQLNFDLLQNDSQEISLLFELADSLKKIYKKSVGKINGKSKLVNPTDTLITKIILGTMGCAPAYDRYFIDGVRHLKKPFSSFNKSAYGKLLDFYRQNSKEILNTQRDIAKTGITYPIMKLIDMYFWNIGFKIDMQT